MSDDDGDKARRGARGDPNAAVGVDDLALEILARTRSIQNVQNT